MKYGAKSRKHENKSHEAQEAFGSPASYFTTFSSSCQSVLLCVHPAFCLSVFPSDKYFMTCLFSCLRRSSHLQLTFYYLFLHPVGDAWTHTITHTCSLHPKGKRRHTGPTYRNKDVTDRVLAGEREEEQEKERETSCSGENLYFLNILQWSLFHHTGRPHSKPCPDTQRERCVCHPTFSYHLRTLL